MAKLGPIALLVFVAAVGCDRTPVGVAPVGVGGSKGGAGGATGGVGGATSGSAGGGGLLGRSLCGDGRVDPGEECDDGNHNDGDGCTRLCQIENAFPPGCSNGAATCPVPTCGDGVLGNAEACDDSNAVSGDGCSADCKSIEPLFTCPVPGRPCVRTCDASSAAAACAPGTCGDGVLSRTEQCDCGTDAAHLPAGCAAVNATEAYGGCTTNCTYGGYCGDGQKEAAGGEECDLGAGNGDAYVDHPADPQLPGCSRGCKVPHFCGDGHVDPAFGEQCDLGEKNGTLVDVGGAKKLVVCDTQCQIVVGG